MRNNRGRNQEVTLLNLARYAPSPRKLQEGTNSNGITNHVENRSPQKPSKNNNPERRSVTVMSIADRYENKRLSSSVETPSKS